MTEEIQKLDVIKCGPKSLFLIDYANFLEKFPRGKEEGNKGIELWFNGEEDIGDDWDFMEGLIELKDSNPKYVFDPKILQGLRYSHLPVLSLIGGSLEDIFDNGELSANSVKKRAQLYVERVSKNPFSKKNKFNVSEALAIHRIRNEIAKEIYLGIVMQHIQNPFDFLKFHPKGSIGCYGIGPNLEFIDNGFKKTFCIADNDSQSNHGHGLATIVEYRKTENPTTIKRNILSVRTYLFKEIDRIECSWESDFNEKWNSKKPF